MSTNGKPIPVLTHAELARFWAHADTRGADGPWCWEWEAFRPESGYGRVTIRRVAYFAHRVAYTIAYGAISQGFVVDHLCRNEACVNPNHLEAVTPATNSRRGNNGAKERARAQCPQQHPYDSENTAHNAKGHRRCKQCNRDRSRAWKVSRRAEA